MQRMVHMSINSFLSGIARLIPSLAGQDASDLISSIPNGAEAVSGRVAVGAMAWIPVGAAVAIAGVVVAAAARAISALSADAAPEAVRETLGPHLAEALKVTRDGGLATEVSGSWFVRHPGTDAFVRMQEDEFRQFESATARDGGILYTVTASGNRVALLRRCGGRLDGDDPSEPAMILLGDGEPRRDYFRRGTNVTDEVRRNSGLAAAALAATVVAGFVGMPAPAKAQDGRTVVFGDSLSVGTAVHLRSGGRAVTDLGITGWGLTRPDWRQRAEALGTAARDASRVVIFVGTNDQGGLPNPTASRNRRSLSFGTAEWKEAYSGRLQAIRDAIPPGVPVLWIGQPVFCDPAFDGRARQLDAELRAVASRSGDRFIAPPSDCTPAVRAPDGIHFTTRGYRAIAAEADREHQAMRR